MPLPPHMILRAEVSYTTIADTQSIPSIVLREALPPVVEAGWSPDVRVLSELVSYVPDEYGWDIVWRPPTEWEYVTVDSRVRLGMRDGSTGELVRSELDLQVWGSVTLRVPPISPRPLLHKVARCMCVLADVCCCVHPALGSGGLRRLEGNPRCRAPKAQ